MTRIGYTLGDLGGIGPEIFAAFKSNHSKDSDYQIVLIDRDPPLVPLGAPSAIAGAHAYKTLQKAHEMLMGKELDYLITGPVAKESLRLAGLDFSGQTEVLAKLNQLNVDQVEMSFILDDLRVVLATRHVPLRSVSQELSRRFETTIINSLKALAEVFNIKNPRIAVAGLNPHAGENGMLGDEEIKIIKPIIDRFPGSVFGPFSADAILAKAAQNYLNQQAQAYDLYISIYHDQALPLIKGIGGYQAINLTLGLPYIRVSPDHGTAFDIAGSGQASYAGLAASTAFCLKLAKKGYNTSIGS